MNATIWPLGHKQVKFKTFSENLNERRKIDRPNSTSATSNEGGHTRQRPSSRASNTAFWLRHYCLCLSLSLTLSGRKMKQYSIFLLATWYVCEWRDATLAYSQTMPFLHWIDILVLVRLWSIEHIAEDIMGPFLYLDYYY